MAIPVNVPDVNAGKRAEPRIGEHGSGERLFRVFNAVFLTLLVLVMVVPFLNVLSVAFSSRLSSLDPGVKLWPTQWSVDGFRVVWINVGLWRAFVNSVIVTSIGTLLHLILAAFAGYVLIQRNLPGKRLMIAFVLATMAIPSELLMIPLFIVNQKLGLLNSLAALVISGLVSGFSILLMRNFFASVPYDLW